MMIAFCCFIYVKVVSTINTLCDLDVVSSSFYMKELSMRLGLVIVLHVVNTVNVTTMHPTSKWTAVYI